MCNTRINFRQSAHGSTDREREWSGEKVCALKRKLLKWNTRHFYFGRQKWGERNDNSASNNNNNDNSNNSWKKTRSFLSLDFEKENFSVTLTTTIFGCLCGDTWVCVLWVYFWCQSIFTVDNGIYYLPFANNALTAVCGNGGRVSERTSSKTFARYEYAYFIRECV